MMRKIFIFLLISTNISCVFHKLYKDEEEITKFLMENKNSSGFNLTLDTISTFQWDELIVVGPYVDIKAISNNIGYNLSNFPYTIKHHDHYILIGFLNNKKGVRYFEVDRYLLSDSTFMGSNANYKIYSKDESNLRIRR